MIFYYKLKKIVVSIPDVDIFWNYVLLTASVAVVVHAANFGDPFITINVFQL